jgi:hypothetical protein
MIDLDRYSHPQNAKEWDDFISEKFEKYGWGLFNFAYSLTCLIMESNLKYFIPPIIELPDFLKYGGHEYYKFIERDIKTKKKLKKDIIKKLRQFPQVDGMYKDDADSIFELYNLKPFFKILDKQICHQEDTLATKFIWGKRGRPVEMRNRLAFVWAQVMKDRRGINWMKIYFLMSWFYEKLEKTTYCKLLGIDGDFDEHNLRKEYYVVTKDKNRQRDLQSAKEACFPSPKKERLNMIEFHKDYINLWPRIDELPALSFPDGESIS